MDELHLWFWDFRGSGDGGADAYACGETDRTQTAMFSLFHQCLIISTLTSVVTVSEIMNIRPSWMLFISAR